MDTVLLFFLQNHFRYFLPVFRHQAAFCEMVLHKIFLAVQPRASLIFRWQLPVRQ